MGVIVLDDRSRILAGARVPKPDLRAKGNMKVASHDALQINTVAWNADGKHLAIDGENAVEIRDASCGDHPS